MKIKISLTCFLFLVLSTVLGYPKNKTVLFCGSVKNDLYILLAREGFIIKRYAYPSDAIIAAPNETAVFIVSDTYPLVDSTRRITQVMVNMAKKKKLKLYVEYPA